MKRSLPSVKWLLPGMRVKRWLLLALFGLLLGTTGLALFHHAQPVDLLSYANRFVEWLDARWQHHLIEGDTASWGGAAVFLVGVGIIVFALSRFWSSLTSTLRPAGSGSLVDEIYRSHYLSQGPRVVVLGGGTGLSTMLRGLKQYTSNIVAVVTVTDDGGSSGKLTKQLNIPPPGDIRNCLVALADSETTMTDLFQYRFRGDGTGDGLRDHNFGNLLIAALHEISHRDFEKAVQLTSRVLNIRGQVLPSTLEQVRLRAEMEDGSVLVGETNIVHSPLKIRRVSLLSAAPEAEREIVSSVAGTTNGTVPSPAPPREETVVCEAKPLSAVLKAIADADIIVIGPGSVFTSVIPPLLVPGIAEALHRAKAKKVYICNVMTQPGETDGFAASDHVKAIAAHVSRPVFDYVMINTALPSQELLEKYRQTGSTLVEADSDRVRSLGYRPLPGSYISQTDVVRHDSACLAESILRLYA
jgi:2-phospho-L-lactate transferase/gluconeogenesis factor (CofD/UPF0052 family)